MLVGELVENEFDELDKGDVFKEFVVEVEVGKVVFLVVFFGGGDEGYVFFYVVGEVVMVVVREFLGEVGYYES